MIIQVIPNFPPPHLFSSMAKVNTRHSLCTKTGQESATLCLLSPTREGKTRGNRFPANFVVTRGAEATTFWRQFYFRDFSLASENIAYFLSIFLSQLIGMF